MAGVTPAEPRGSDKDAQQLQGRLMHVSRLATIGEMAAGVAHELNQPLTAITTYAQACTRLLDRMEPNLGDVRDALQQIASQAVRAGAIIRRLRSLVRHTDSERRPTDINELVEELRELMESDARVHGVRLRLELAQGLPRVMADGVQIQHVLLNLLRNALEALSLVAPSQREVVVNTALVRYRPGRRSGDRGAHLRSVLYHQGVRDGTWAHDQCDNSAYPWWDAGPSARASRGCLFICELARSLSRST